MPGGFQDQFRSGFAAAQGAKHAITVATAMLLMQAIPGAVGVGAGDEFICDHVVQLHGIACLHTNLIPVWADVRPDDYMTDPASVEEPITPGTKATCVTDLWGFPAEVDRLREIADRHGIYLLQDCAHPLFAEYKGQPIGWRGHFGTYFFNKGKQPPTGEGGAATIGAAHHVGELNTRTILSA